MVRRYFAAIVVAAAAASVVSPGSASATVPHFCDSNILLFGNPYPLNPGPAGCFGYPDASADTHYILPGTTSIDVDWAVDPTFGPVVPGRMQVPGGNVEQFSMLAEPDYDPNDATDVTGHRYTSDRAIAIQPTSLGAFFTWVGNQLNPALVSSDGGVPDAVTYRTVDSL